MGSDLEISMENRLEPKVGTRRRARPGRIWLRFLGLGYALFSLAGWIRMIDSVVDWYWLNFAGVRPGPLYLTISGGLWGVAGLTALIWLWLRRPRYRLICSLVALFLALTYWIDQLFIAHIESVGYNYLFAALMTLVGLAYVTLVLRPFEEFSALFKRGSHDQNRTGN